MNVYPFSASKAALIKFLIKLHLKLFTVTTAHRTNFFMFKLFFLILDSYSKYAHAIKCINKPK